MILDLKKHIGNGAEYLGKKEDMSKDFVEFIHGEGASIYIQSYSDVKSENFFGLKYGELSSSKITSFVKKADAKKASVCVNINSFKCGGRNKANLAGINAVFIDADGVQMPEKSSFPVEPHCITSRDPTHWHCYWKVEDCTEIEWKRAQVQLALYFGGDLCVKDVTRVMRLPGFSHYKNPNEPQMYSIKLLNKNCSKLNILDILNKHPLDKENENLLELLLSSESQKNRGGMLFKDHAFSNHPYNIDTCVKHLQKIPPAIEGCMGDIATFRACCLGVDYDLDINTFTPYILQHFNSRCLPPWDYESLLLKIKNAYYYSSYEIGCKTPQTMFNKTPDKGEETQTFKPSWETELEANTKTGAIKPTFKNLLIFMDNHKELKDKIYLDTFDGYIKHKDINFLNQKRNNVWSDSDTITVRVFINKFGFDMNTKNIDDVINAIASKNQEHPVEKYFNALVWDGVGRIDTWLTDHLGVAPSEYSSKVGVKTLCAAVARIYSPGIKFDNILILEGEQGLGKSMAIEALAGKDWFTDDVGEIKEKDTIAKIQGVLLAEISELESFKKTDITALKAFLSRSMDKKRMPYDRRPSLFPRQCVFIGTTNDSSYLHDETGGRRFWPVNTSGKINIPNIKKNRDMLWAEAVVRFRMGESLYLDNPELLKHAKEEQENRRFSDEWESAINDYVEDNGLKRVTSKELWCIVFGNNIATFGRLEQARIARCLKALGFSRKAYYDTSIKKTVKGYIK